MYKTEEKKEREEERREIAERWYLREGEGRQNRACVC
jgi:hypothetical protein